MANLNARLKQNVSGPYYVTDECVDCDMCRGIAPTIFSRDDSIGYSVVIRQPGSEEERAEAEEAIRNCPVEAIGRV